jgi:cytidylate kinase
VSQAPRVLAIDGPAASGKSSTARAVAERLAWNHLDSGALYRFATWVALRDALHRGEEIAAHAAAEEVALAPDGASLRLRVAGESVDHQIRTPEVTARVSEVSAYPGVRAWANRILRGAVEQGHGIVLDGRDIGTVVFPDAPLKVFLTASPEARALRRLLQVGAAVDPVALAAEAARLEERDRLDAAREVAPLRRAEDAQLLDTTTLTFAEQVDRIVSWAGEKGLIRRS